MGNGEARAVGKLLHGLDGEVGADGPVGAQDDGHDNHQGHIVLKELRQGEHDEPVGGSGLLHLHVAGGEQGAALRDPVEADQKDVDDERDEQQGHRLGEALSEDFFHACGNSVLAVIRVNDAGRQVEAVLQSREDRAEGAGQSAGTGVQDQHADDGLQSAGKCVVPLFPHQAVAQQGQEADHVRRLLQHVGREERPD